MGSVKARLLVANSHLSFNSCIVCGHCTAHVGNFSTTESSQWNLILGTITMTRSEEGIGFMFLVCVIQLPIVLLQRHDDTHVPSQQYTWWQWATPGHTNRKWADRKFVRTVQFRVLSLQEEPQTVVWRYLYRWVCACQPPALLAISMFFFPTKQPTVWPFSNKKWICYTKGSAYCEISKKELITIWNSFVESFHCLFVSEYFHGFNLFSLFQNFVILVLLPLPHS